MNLKPWRLCREPPESTRLVLHTRFTRKESGKHECCWRLAGSVTPAATYTTAAAYQQPASRAHSVRSSLANTVSQSFFVSHGRESPCLAEGLMQTQKENCEIGQINTWAAICFGQTGLWGNKKPGYKTSAAGLKENEEEVQVADGIRRLDALWRYRAEGDTATLKTLNFQEENSHL